MNATIDTAADAIKAHRDHLLKQKSELLTFIKSVNEITNLPDGPLKERRLWETRLASHDILALYAEVPR